MSVRQWVQKVPLFAGFDDHEKLILSEHFDHRVLPPGEPAFTAGDRVSACYVLVNGTIQVKLPAEGGAVDETAELTPGQFFGHLAMIGRRRTRTASCVAGQGGAQLLRLTRDDFDLLFEGHGALSLRFLDLMTADLARSMRATHEHLRSVIHDSNAEIDAPRDRPGTLDDVDLDTVEFVVSDRDRFRTTRKN